MDSLVKEVQQLAGNSGLLSVSLVLSVTSSPLLVIWVLQVPSWVLQDMQAWPPFLNTIPSNHYLFSSSFSLSFNPSLGKAMFHPLSLHKPLKYLPVFSLRSVSFHQMQLLQL